MSDRNESLCFNILEAKSITAPLSWSILCSNSNTQSHDEVLNKALPHTVACFFKTTTVT